MKRLLSILASIGLVATASTAVVSCGTKTEAPNSPDYNGPTFHDWSFDGSMIKIDGTNIPSELSNKNFLVEIKTNYGQKELGINKIGSSPNNIWILLKEKYQLAPKEILIVHYNFKGQATEKSPTISQDIYDKNNNK